MARLAVDKDRKKPWRAAYHGPSGEVFLGYYPSHEEALQVEQDYMRYGEALADSNAKTER